MKVQLRAMGVACAVLCSTGFLLAQAQQGGAPKPVPPGAQEMLANFNEVHAKLVAMAKDFPEDKFDFKVQKEQRSFAENILHVAGVDYEMMSAIAGKKMGPSLPNQENPSRDTYKTKADVVGLISQAMKDGDDLIKAQGDAGLTAVIKNPFANQMSHSWAVWLSMIEHAGEHYGQCVVYYRANNLVPPDSRH